MTLFLLFLFSAIVFGWIESYTMEHGFSPGPPNLWGFRWQYHGAVLSLALALAYATNRWFALPWWFLLEDLTFFAMSKWAFSYKFRLTEDAWIARLMGSTKVGKAMIPIAYLFLLVAGWFSLSYL
jgi:hypothetical protein